MPRHIERPILRFAIVALTILGCSRPTPPTITNTRLLVDTAVPPPTLEPFVLHQVELDPQSEEAAGPRDWVLCVGGLVMNGEARIEVCRDPSRAWVDPARDEVTLLVHASNAYTVRARAGKATSEAPFINGRARLRVGLRSAIAELDASRVAAETTLVVGLEIEHDAGVAKGELGLRTPRVFGLMASVVDGPVTFESDNGGVGGSQVLVLGPEPDLYPKAPQVPLRDIDVIVVDIGTTITVLPCPLGDAAAAPIVSAIRAGRTVRPPRLTAYERRSGEQLGEHLFQLQAPPCPGEDVTGNSLITPDILAETIAHLAAGRPSPLPSVTSRLDLSDTPLGDPNKILAFKTFLGLSASSTEDEVIAKLGAVRFAETSRTREAKVVALVTGRSVGALIDATTGKLLEVWLDGTNGAFDLERNALITKHLDAKDIVDRDLLDLVRRPLQAALDLLGRPTHPVARSDGFYAWTVDAASLTVFVELHCEASSPYICKRLHVGWLLGEDPHDGGDIPGAKHKHDSHRDPHEHHDHEAPDGTPASPQDSP